MPTCARNMPGTTSRPARVRGRISAARTADKCSTPAVIVLAQVTATVRVQAIATDLARATAIVPVRATATGRAAGIAGQALATVTVPAAATVQAPATVRARQEIAGRRTGRRRAT